MMLGIRVVLGLVIFTSMLTSMVQAAPAKKYPQIKYVEPDLVEFVHQIQFTAGSGVHSLGTYSPQVFKKNAALAELEKRDRVPYGCRYRIYGEEATQSIDVYRKMLTRRNPFDDKRPTGMTDARAEQLSDQILDLMLDPDNRGVFSSQRDPAGKDDPVGCGYFNFLILRPSGTAIFLNFD